MHLTLNGTDPVWKTYAPLEITDALRNAWKKIPSELTTEEVILIKNYADNFLIDASAEDAAVAQEIYEQYKVEGAELIAIDVSLPEKAGILNCRKNMEHIQIRF